MPVRFKWRSERAEIAPRARACDLSDQIGHGRSVDHTQPLDAMHAELRIEHGYVRPEDEPAIPQAQPENDAGSSSCGPTSGDLKAGAQRKRGALPSRLNEGELSLLETDRPDSRLRGNDEHCRLCGNDKEFDSKSQMWHSRKSKSVAPPLRIA